MHDDMAGYATKIRFGAGWRVAARGFRGFRLSILDLGYQRLFVRSFRRFQPALFHPRFSTRSTKIFAEGIGARSRQKSLADKY